LVIGVGLPMRRLATTLKRTNVVCVMVRSPTMPTTSNALTAEKTPAFADLDSGLDVRIWRLGQENKTQTGDLRLLIGCTDIL
jgi:hypothetical protein